MKQELVALENDWWSSELLQRGMVRLEINPHKGAYSRKRDERGKNGTKSEHVEKIRRINKDVNRVGLGNK